MNDIIPINKNIDKMNDNELLRNFNKDNPPFGRINYYAIFAKRITKFKNILKEEILDNENNIESAMGIIKISWLPLISILYYVKEESEKKNFVSLAKNNWTNNNFEDFKNFIKDDGNLSKYL